MKQMQLREAEGECGGLKTTTIRNNLSFSGMSRTGTLCPCRWVGQGTNT